MRVFGVIFAVLALWAAAVGLGQTTTRAARVAVPEGAAVSEALALANDVFKGDVAAARTPEQKSALVRKYVNAGKEEKGVGRYVLLGKARDLAVEIGDADGCEAALTEIAASYEVDELKMRAEAYTALARTVRLPEEFKKLGRLLAGAVDTALMADRFDEAKALADLCQGMAMRASDLELKVLSANNLAALKETEAAYADVKKSLEVLADKPGDAEANLSVGKYRCFVKGDWQGGLPMLALGNDAALKALAEKELKGIAAEGQLAVGNGWWEVADKLTGKAKGSVQEHAAEFYKEASPTLTGMIKKKVDTRIAEVDAERVRQIEAGIRKPLGRVDLLALVEPSRDSVKGTWVKKDGVLTSPDGEGDRLQFPYHPGEEYDFRLEFSRLTGNRDVNMILAEGETQFAWYMGGYHNSVAGFGAIKGANVSEGPAVVKGGAILENGKRYEAVVKVRKDGLAAYMNGKLVVKWKTDYSDLTNHSWWALNDTLAVGLGTGNQAVIYKAEIVEITGKGTVVKGP